MLREFVEKKHVKFADSAPDWRGAIRMSWGGKLIADGNIKNVFGGNLDPFYLVSPLYFYENYKEDIIACVEKYGPYIVIAPNIAMPHSQEGAKGVHKTEIAFMKLKKPVSFEEGNPELDAQLFFTLAACNNEQHLQNMSRLSEMLMNEELVEELADAKPKKIF